MEITWICKITFTVRNTCNANIKMQARQKNNDFKTETYLRVVMLTAKPIGSVPKSVRHLTDDKSAARRFVDVTTTVFSTRTRFPSQENGAVFWARQRNVGEGGGGLHPASVRRSLRLAACINSAPAGRIFMKLGSFTKMCRDSSTNWCFM